MLFNFTFDDFIDIIFSWWAIVIYIITAIILSRSANSMKNFTNKVDFEADILSQIEVFKQNRNSKKVRKYLAILFTVFAIVGIIFITKNNWNNIMDFMNSIGTVFKVIFYIIVVMLLLMIFELAIKLLKIAIPIAIFIFIVYWMVKILMA